MASETFARTLDYLKRSGVRQVPVLGGEPTIHPLFCRFADMIEQQGLDLLLFSNGRMPARALTRLKHFPVGRLTILLNIDPAHCRPVPADKRLRRVLESLGQAIIPGCNIHHSGVSPAPLLPLITRFGLAPVVRVGLAHPCVGAVNRWLHPHQYRTVGRSLGIFARQLLERRIRLEFDCGFVPCMFDQNDLELLTAFGELPGARCNPLPDILPDGRAIPCYPLANVCQTWCGPDDDSRSVRARLSWRLAVYTETGIYGECGGCQLRHQGRCNGGCRAVAMQRLRPLPLAERIAVGIERLSRACTDSSLVVASSEPQQGVESAWSDTPASSGLDTDVQWTIPYIDQPLSFWRELRVRYGSAIREVYLPLPGNLLASGRPALPEKRLDTFLRNSPLPVSVLLNPVALLRPAASMADSVIAALKKLRTMTRVNSVTVADIGLARRLRDHLPDLSLTASVLMDVCRPHQASQLVGLFDSLVPASRIMRNYAALQALHQAFPGTLRLLVNEGCLPDCLMRVQHFYEMAYAAELPVSLCEPLLEWHPWMRLTGAWVLPQHLHFFDGLTHAFKLAGRATLQDPEHYMDVLDAYMHRRPLTPDAMGGGPASPIAPIGISDEYYRATLHCDKNCHVCSVCKEYYAQWQQILACKNPQPLENGLMPARKDF